MSTHNSTWTRTACASASCMPRPVRRLSRHPAGTRGAGCSMRSSRSISRTSPTSLSSSASARKSAARRGWKARCREGSPKGKPTGQALLTLSASDIEVEEVAVGAVTADANVALDEGGPMTVEGERAGHRGARATRDHQSPRLSGVRPGHDRPRQHRRGDPGPVSRADRRPLGQGVGDGQRFGTAVGPCGDSRSHRPSRARRHGARNSHRPGGAGIHHRDGGSVCAGFRRPAHRRGDARHSHRSVGRRPSCRRRSRCISTVHCPSCSRSDLERPGQRR